MNGISFKPLTLKHTRVKRFGSHIQCPNCRSISKVYHLAWSGLGCQHCKEMIDKQNWYIEV